MTTKKFRFIVTQQVGDFEPVKVVSLKSRNEAEAAIRIFERDDRNEMREGYGFPHGMPKYSIVEERK